MLKRLLSSWTARIIVGTAIAGGIALSLPTMQSTAQTVESCSSVQPADSNDDPSGNGWFYTKFQLCADTDGNKINLNLTASDSQYYWGSAWYSDNYNKAVSSSFVVSRDGRTVDSGQLSQSTRAATATAAKTLTEGPPGSYTITVQPTLTGGYWANNGYPNSVITTSDPMSVTVVFAGAPTN